MYVSKAHRIYHDLASAGVDVNFSVGRRHGVFDKHKGITRPGRRVSFASLSICVFGLVNGQAILCYPILFVFWTRNPPLGGNPVDRRVPVHARTRYSRGRGGEGGEGLQSHVITGV